MCDWCVKKHTSETPTRSCFYFLPESLDPPWRSNHYRSFSIGYGLGSSWGWNYSNAPRSLLRFRTPRFHPPTLARFVRQFGPRASSGVGEATEDSGRRNPVGVQGRFVLGARFSPRGAGRSRGAVFAGAGRRAPEKLRGSKCQHHVVWHVM